MGRRTQAQTNALRRLATAKEALARHMNEVVDLGDRLVAAFDGVVQTKEINVEVPAKLTGTMDEIQKRAVLERIEMWGSKRAAAMSLDVAERTFLRWCERYGIAQRAGIKRKARRS